MSANVYKRLSVSDTFVVPYTANKSWDITSGSFAANKINVNIGVNHSGSIFDPTSEYITNGQYDRLVYDSINLTYYPTFLPKKVDNTLRQNTLLNDGTLTTSSYYRGHVELGNTNTIKFFPTGAGALIYVLNIPKNLTSEKILPTTFEAYFATGSSSFKVYDDGNYNLLYSGSNVASSVGTTLTAGSQIGNIFYEQNVAILTIIPNSLRATSWRGADPYCIAAPTSPSVSVSVTPSVSISLSATPSITPTVTLSVSPSPSFGTSVTPTVTPSVTPSISETPSVSVTPSISETPSPSETPSISVTPSITVSVTPTVTPTISVTPSTSVPYGCRLYTNDNVTSVWANWTDCSGGSVGCTEVLPGEYICAIDGSPTAWDNLTDCINGYGTGATLTPGALGCIPPSPTPSTSIPETPLPSPSTPTLCYQGKITSGNGFYTWTNCDGTPGSGFLNDGDYSPCYQVGTFSGTVNAPAECVG